MHGDSVREHLQARCDLCKDEEEEARPYAGKTAPTADLYPDRQTLLRKRCNWVSSVEQGSGPKPNEQQARCLKAVIDRAEREAAEERSGLNAQRASKHEPMLDVVHGYPGTGKTRVIAWVREYFEKVLGWTHSVQFVCLSFQNVMAPLVNAKTIHHW